jgi:chorismate synthase
MRVAAGAVCKHFLRQFGIEIGGYVVCIGSASAELDGMPSPERFARAEASEVRCPDAGAAARMQAEIEAAIRGKNTLGGVLEIAALNVPMGLGSFAQWDRRLEARLAMAVMSVQAIKGVEVGDAFANARLPGTQAQDAIRTHAGSIIRPSNRAGGTEGGISNGQPLLVRAAMKPIATTLTPQVTVDLATGEDAVTHYERSDFCPVPRAVPILEAMVALVLADALLEKLGGDSMAEIQPRFEALSHGALEQLQMDNTEHIWWA